MPGGRGGGLRAAMVGELGFVVGAQPWEVPCARPGISGGFMVKGV